MPPTTGVATVLSDGHIALPKEMREELGLHKGCRLELTVHRVLPTHEKLEDALLSAVKNQETSIEELELLVRQLKSYGEPSSHLLQELEAIARAVMPKAKQRRVSRLLYKQSCGEITTKEKQELDALVQEGQIWNVYKGAAVWVLKQFGIDLFPELTRQAKR